MATLTRSTTIHAPVSRVFDLALDISKLWRAEDVALTDVDIKPEGVGTSARMFSHVLGFHIEGGLEYTEVVPRERIVAQVHFFAEKPTWTFTFHEADGDTNSPARLILLGDLRRALDRGPRLRLPEPAATRVATWRCGPASACWPPCLVGRPPRAAVNMSNPRRMASVRLVTDMDVPSSTPVKCDLSGSG